MILSQQLRPALTLFVLLSVLTGIAYPLGITGLAGLLMPEQAGGSLIRVDNVVRGSHLIGQNFTTARYFQPRLSATMGTDPSDPSKSVSVPYNASASAASNLGPTSKTLVDRVHAAAAAQQVANPDAIASGWKVPTELVTASGSGLDPDISPRAALFQVKRIAHARNLPEDRVTDLVSRMTEPPLMGWLGEPRVNVLDLNMALDKLAR